MMEFNFKTNQDILKELANKLIKKRKSINLTQKELALKAGFSFRTLQQFESGGNITLLNLIAILRTLGELRLLNNFSEEEEFISPRAIHLKTERLNKKEK